MLRSMTGFGRAEGVVNGRKLTVEVRSLNSKQLDLLVKVPGSYKENEIELRRIAGERIVRGKAEVFIGVEGLHAAKRTSFDRQLIEAYHTELSAIAQAVAPDAKTDLLALVLRMPDVMTQATDQVGEEEWTGALELFNEALGRFDGFRSAEGQRLQEELAGRVASIERLLAEAERSDPARIERTRERIATKLAEIQAKVDPERFEQELVYYLEKLDITEEKVRLRSHCTYFKETMGGDTEQGRKLNFIAQEMGREINTIGSKANDATIQRLVVMMKDELEKVKEQVLNVL
ncbi:MAG: YicC family protein [Flavobacteriales bacterium]|nr:YicC family protein [Flavobacteriales bacterium]